MTEKAPKNNDKNTSTARKTRNVGPQQTKANKTISNTRNGSHKVGRQSGQNPVAYTTTTTTTRPVINYKGSSNKLTISHKELVSTLTSDSTQFQNVARLRINAASYTTFPWLSTIANGFEQYRFSELSFHYIPRVPTTTVGTCMLVPDYDAADTNPLTAQSASANVGTREDNIFKNLTVNFSPQSMNRAYKSHFCMSDSRFANTKQDQKTIDAGQFHVIFDTNANLTMGKLWVKYTVHFDIPQSPELPMALGGAGTNKNSYIQANAAQVFTNPDVSIDFQEVAPILKKLPPSSFPGNDLFEFVRDWSGQVNSQFVTSGVNLLTNIPAITKNRISYTGIDVIEQPTVSANQHFGTSSILGSFKQGDILGLAQGGLQQTGGNVVDNIIFNLGGRSLSPQSTIL